MMVSCCRSCVSCALLASYAVLLCVGGVGVWLAVSNFGEEEPLPPTPPPQLQATTTTTTTTTPNRYGSYSYNRNEEDRIPQAYKDYVSASVAFSRPTNDAKLYVLLPCVVSVIVAAMVLLGGLCSREFFCSTFGLYSSLGVWILTLTWSLVYQDAIAYNSRMDLDAVCWIIGIHVVLMLLLSTQILLCVWELRRQNVGWPTINCRTLVTGEALLLAARVTLTVYTIIHLSDSRLIRGYRVPEDIYYKEYYKRPGIRFPLTFTLVCLSAACYNAVATIESLLSMLLGKLHTRMTTVTTLLSALCCVAVAVINSPVVVRALIAPTYVETSTMYFSIGLSVVTFLHMIACLAFPTASRSPPEILSIIITGVVSATRSLVNDVTSEQLWRSSFLQNKGRVNLFFNFISSVFCIFSIIIIPAVWDSPLYRSWGSVMVLCANSATLVRTLPAVVTELRFKQADNTPINQKLIAMTLESATLLVGSIAVCARSYYGGEIFGGVINLLFFIFQMFIIVHLVKGKFKAAPSEETKHLSENEVPTSQDEEEQQIPRDLLA